MIDIEKYIYDIREAETVENAFQIFQLQLASFGLDRAVYSLMTDFSSLALPAGHAILGNYPDDWMQYYRDKGYEDVDPVRKVLMLTNEPFKWSDLARYRNLERLESHLMGEANEALLQDGVGLGLHCPNGEVIGMGFASSSGKADLNPYVLSMIRFLALEFHAKFVQLNAHRMRRTPNFLTPREIEILVWMARGKTIPEIAKILSINGSLSLNTVKFHQKNIYAKLDVSNSVNAIMKAFFLGILTRADLNNYI